MVPVKEEEISSFDDNAPVESNKRHKPSVAIQPNRSKMASRLQRAWRNIFRQRRSQSFAQWFLDALTMDHVKSIRLICLFNVHNPIQPLTLFPLCSFEALVVFLREKPIVAVARNCVQRIHLSCTFLYGSPRAALLPEHVNVRVVLAAYMIAGRPTHVFESMGVLEQALYESALVLTTNLERLARSIAQTGNFHLANANLAESFPTVLFEYLKRFKAWKIPDEVKLVCRIKHALIALYQAEQHLPPDEPEDSKLKIEFRTQIERLRSKLQQIGGASALAEFDEERKKGGPVLPPSDESGGAGGAYSALPGRMTNEQLAHELLLDPTFQLSDTGGGECENPVFHRIRASFHQVMMVLPLMPAWNIDPMCQAFWDSLVDDLKLASPCYVRVLRVLAEIRDGIVDLAGSREATAIRGVIDIELIKQQTDSGAFNWDTCKQLVGSVVTVIKRIQAPSRDSATLERWREVGLAMQKSEKGEYARVFCRALEFLLDLVNILRVDAANAR